MYSISTAHPADAALIHEIKMRAFAEEGRLSESTDIPPLTETVSAIESEIRTQTVLVARDAERIVGSARGIVTDTLLNICTIRAVFVDPGFQGLGIGAALLHSIESAHPNVARFVLTTSTLVPGNVAFYERHGYRVTELTKYNEKIALAQMCKDVSVSVA